MLVERRTRLFLVPPSAVGLTSKRGELTIVIKNSRAAPGDWVLSLAEGGTNQRPSLRLFLAVLVLAAKRPAPLRGFVLLAFNTDPAEQESGEAYYPKTSVLVYWSLWNLIR